MNQRKNKGFISVIVAVLGALITLKYAFNVDVVGFLTSGRFREFWDLTYSWSAKGWNEYSDILVKVAKGSVDLIKNLLDKFFKN